MASEGPRWYVQLVLFMLCLTPYANAESHRLQYNLFAMVSSDGEPPSYSAHGYLDDELFLHYDSESQRPEPRGTWLDGLVETDTWKKEKSNVKEIGQDFKITLRQIMDQSNLNTGSHTFQETLGCELHEDGTRRGFWKYGYDGRDFLILQPETLTWKAVHPAAGNLKNALEEEPREIKIKKAKTEGDCCDQLLSYLKFWQEKKAAFPLLNVTQKENREGKVTLRCCAYSFVPRDIKMTWLQNGHALSHSDHERGIIQPSGDGTYQTWVSIDVHSEESNYTCHVEHQGRNQTISVPLGTEREGSSRMASLYEL
ncbi:major histocompatibility complex class I-related gene protein-like isoform X2 [Vombatus ursinus]|uniref:major histocompatibility complex class I-related gene protein-like isoform X2 n=1 Tax=Vombatus ursinus TaxID=29139 RepID=UPI000FFD48AD|nr:major histocompatibility complex class I-related gene protein-like isoform X2 [Vombatus ursinus]